MPVDPNANVEITAFRWVPDFAQGLVRDLRIRWALEEIGRPYRVRLLDALNPRPADYFCEQPFGQVPAYQDDRVQLFESGAILIHLAIEEERLLPVERNARMRAIAWLIAALNSVEPALFPLIMINIFNKGEAWTAFLKSVTLPSGTSSAQLSTIRVAPNSLNRGAAPLACLL